MAKVVRTIDTPRGPLVVTVQRVADRGTMWDLTADDLLKAARVLFWEAALVSRQERRPEPEAATPDPPTVLALLDEIERLRREKEVLAAALHHVYTCEDCECATCPEGTGLSLRAYRVLKERSRCDS